MKRETAEKFVMAANDIDKILDRMDKILDEISDDSEKKKIKIGIVGVVTTLYEQLTREVVKDHPDLHPDIEPVSRDRY